MSTTWEDSSALSGVHVDIEEISRTRSASVSYMGSTDTDLDKIESGEGGASISDGAGITNTELNLLFKNW